MTGDADGTRPGEKPKLDFSAARTLPMAEGGASQSAIVLNPGELFAGRYRIEALIGRGGAGDVYRAQDANTDEHVALKLLSGARVSTPEARRQLVREAIVARQIRHPNVVAVHDVGQAGDVAYIVMELLSGTTMRAWLADYATKDFDLPYAGACAIIQAILDGLEAAHAQGVVHRDLKPENVFILAEPTAMRARLKLLDFGLARTEGSAMSGATMMGTPHYMPPEQKTAPDTVKPSADLYSLSMMFYELLVGVLPQGHWQPPSRGRSDVPAGVDALIEAGLSNRPRIRPQSVAEYRAALLAASEPKPQPKVEAAATPPPQPQPKAEAPRPAPVAAPPTQQAAQPERPRVDVGGAGLPREFESWLRTTDAIDRPIPFMPGKMQPYSADAEKRAAPEVKRAWDVAREATVQNNAGNRPAARAKRLEAQQLFLIQIVKGSVEARFAYADFIRHTYMSMRDTPESLAATRAWHAAAAEAGHEKAKLALAWMLRRGDGGPPDRMAAFRLFDELAQKGHSDAVKGLAYLYGDEGRDQEQREQLTRYFSIVSKGGDVDSYPLNRLALLALEGKGGPLDKDEALAALSLAARQKYAMESRQLMQKHFPKQAAAEKKFWPT